MRTFPEGAFDHASFSTPTDDLDAGPRDVVWPLQAGGDAAFAAAKLAELSESRLVSADELRAIGMRLMRCGPPVGWMGALLVLDSNRIADCEPGVSGHAAERGVPLDRLLVERTRSE